ncbi:hypothetical protein l11_20290 [Neisseria weaveri LMG 5135]|nr:hypothetical protein l11_20290 [Neisseria weaveri LMG 5135]
MPITVITELLMLRFLQFENGNDIFRRPYSVLISSRPSEKN